MRQSELKYWRKTWLRQRVQKFTEEPDSKVGAPVGFISTGANLSHAAWRMAQADGKAGISARTIARYLEELAAEGKIERRLVKKVGPGIGTGGQFYVYTCPYEEYGVL